MQYLTDHGVDVMFDTTVDNIIVDFDNGTSYFRTTRFTCS